jgi:hypothetical protein
METPKTRKRTLITVKQQMKEISKWITPLILVQPKYKTSNKALPVRT